MATFDVFVGNLPCSIAKEDIIELFSEAGDVVSCQINDNPVSLLRNDTFGFVNYRSLKEAELAVSMFDGSDFGGVKLKVELSHQTKMILSNKSTRNYSILGAADEEEKDVACLLAHSLRTLGNDDWLKGKIGITTKYDLKVFLGNVTAVLSSLSVVPPGTFVYPDHEAEPGLTIKDLDDLAEQAKRDIQRENDSGRIQTNKHTVEQQTYCESLRPKDCNKSGLSCNVDSGRSLSAFTIQACSSRDLESAISKNKPENSEVSKNLKQIKKQQDRKRTEDVFRSNVQNCDMTSQSMNSEVKARSENVKSVDKTVRNFGPKRSSHGAKNKGFPFLDYEEYKQRYLERYFDALRKHETEQNEIDEKGLKEEIDQGGLEEEVNKEWKEEEAEKGRIGGGS